MKLRFIIGLCLSSQAIFADGLPVITVQPTNQIVSPGGTATLVVTATGATSFQWRFNGTDILGATNSTLQIVNVQTTNSGYYLVVAKNAIGWAPSQLTYLSIDFTQGGTTPWLAGTVPLSNKTNTYFQGQAIGCDGNPINYSRAQVVAGPQLDQMLSYGASVSVSNGYYHSSVARTVPTVAPGQDVYYRVEITYTNVSGYLCQDTNIALSTVMKLVADGGSFPTPSVYGLKFPGWWVTEGIEPALEYTTPTNQVRIPGEAFSFTNQYFAYTDYGTPTACWRKDGNPIPGATNFTQISGGSTGGDFRSVLTITNVQAADAGVYELVVIGNNWFVGLKTVLSIQITNGFGVFISPRLGGTNFVCDLLGAAGRYYAIQWSTNLTDWYNYTTQYNSAGTITFSNSLVLGGAQFYRAKLLP
jgi:hypothetical protein